jgi:hypothetical protein
MRFKLVLGLAFCLAVITGIIDIHSTEVLPSILCLLIFSGVLGMLSPKWAWLWALLIGLSIPTAYFIAAAIHYAPADPPRFPISTAVLVVPALIAAYGGALVNFVLNPPQPGSLP